MDEFFYATWESFRPYSFWAFCYVWACIGAAVAIKTTSGGDWWKDPEVTAMCRIFIVPFWPAVYIFRIVDKHW